MNISFLHISFEPENHPAGDEQRYLALEKASANASVTTQSYWVATTDQAINLVRRIDPTHLALDSLADAMLISEALAEVTLLVDTRSPRDYREAAGYFSTHLLQSEVAIVCCDFRTVAMSAHGNADPMTTAIVKTVFASTPEDEDWHRAYVEFIDTPPVAYYFAAVSTANTERSFVIVHAGNFESFLRGGDLPKMGTSENPPAKDASEKPADGDKNASTIESPQKTVSSKTGETQASKTALDDDIQWKITPTIALPASIRVIWNDGSSHIFDANAGGYVPFTGEEPIAAGMGANTESLSNLDIGTPEWTGKLCKVKLVVNPRVTNHVTFAFVSYRTITEKRIVEIRSDRLVDHARRQAIHTRHPVAIQWEGDPVYYYYPTGISYVDRARKPMQAIAETKMISSECKRLCPFTWRSNVWCSDICTVGPEL